LLDRRHKNPLLEKAAAKVGIFLTPDKHSEKNFTVKPCFQEFTASFSLCGKGETQLIRVLDEVGRFPGVFPFPGYTLTKTFVDFLRLLPGYFGSDERMHCHEEDPVFCNALEINYSRMNVCFSLRLGKVTATE
jgi:hypothetical protein